MNKFYAYIRVSTTRQGEGGVSLIEQRSAIEQYAKQKGLVIGDWFEEQVSAAKRGRPVFSRMLRQLRLKKAPGVIIHKIDRSSRNLKDWSDIGDLVDSGIQVHFSNEPLDLTSRGGRLSADMLAVIASDFIRNLREETKKGFYGRLKQGFYPMPAPLGYLDQGGGKPKVIDPRTSPLVKECFSLYASGRYSIATLTLEMHRRGLRSKSGRRIGWQSLSNILRNPFYTGIIQINKTGETYVGVHKAMIPSRAFRTVQEMLKGKVVRARAIHDYQFRGSFACKECGRSLIGERQKGRVYYRCHGRTCSRGAIREDSLEGVVMKQLKKLAFSHDEAVHFPAMLKDLRQEQVQSFERAVAAAESSLAMTKVREARLTDAYLDGVVDELSYRERITALRVERCESENRLRELQENPASLSNWLAEVLELAKNAHSTYETTSTENRRELVKILCSNRVLDTKQPMFTLDPAYQRVADRHKFKCGGPCSSSVRTFLICEQVIKDLSSLYHTNVLREPLFASRMSD